jgi:hypothetical protein
MIRGVKVENSFLCRTILSHLKTQNLFVSFFGKQTFRHVAETKKREKIPTLLSFIELYV